MLREAELFVMAEDMLVEVLGRIRDVDLDIELPALFDEPGFDRPATLRQVVAQCTRDDARVPTRLGGRPGDEPEDDGDRHAGVARVARAACAAAAELSDGDAAVGGASARDYLLRLTVSRSLIAHYVAAYLGSTACPLPEELGRSLWELTEADAQTWRERGYFREPLFPIPDRASWRDTFLRTAGHEPHPLGH